MSRGRLNLATALNRGLDEVLSSDPRAVLLGEDIGTLGGVFRITQGLQERYGRERVADTPLAEAGLVGLAIGMALAGQRPIVEIQFDGFVYPALNQICSHLAKIGERVGDPSAAPVMIRVPYGGGIGAAEHHSESPEAIFAHHPDLLVVSASDPRTAGSLLVSAYRLERPVIFMEPKRLYRKAVVAEGSEVAVEDPLKAQLRRDGADITLIGYGPTVDVLDDAATLLDADGIHATVLDLVSLAPLDERSIHDAVERTGRVCVVTEAVRRCSIASEVVALIVCSQVFASLKDPPAIVAAPNAPYPPARGEHDYLPSVDRVVASVKEVMGVA